MSDKIKCSRCKHKLAKNICGLSQSPYYNKIIVPTDSCDYFLENPAQIHLLNGEIMVLKMLTDGTTINNQHEVIKEFETAINIGLPQDDEMKARLHLGDIYTRISRKNFGKLSRAQVMDSQESIEAINQFEKAVLMDFQGGYGYFSEPSNRRMLEVWDLFYTINGSVIRDRDGVDAAIAYYEQKLHLFDYLPSTPMLHLSLDLGGLYIKKNDNRHAYECYKKILEADVVVDNQNEANTRKDARGNLELLGYTEENTQKIINDKINRLGSDINNLKKECSKKFCEAGKLAYIKYNNNNNNKPDFMDLSDIRIKWYAILAIDSEINKINQEIEALNSKEKKSGFFAKMGDLISKTAKQGKSKIDLYTLGNKKDNNITEFGEQLYAFRDNGTLTLEELTSIWQKVDEFNKEIEIKEGEILTLKK